jgi:periplasmic copper chaperone A
MHRIAIALASLAAAAAQAHVVLEYKVAPAGSYYKASFQVGHGCGKSATRQVVVQVPEAVVSAHPQPKAGWTVAIDKAGERATRITWTAKGDADKLPSDFYDEFQLMAKLPAEPATLYWPVVQICDEGRAEWTQVPAAGQAASGLKSPAAVLEVLPNEGGGHKH